MKTPTSVRSVTPLVLTLLLAAAARADVVIPSSAFSSGRNSAEFHSDVRVFNPTNSPIDFTPIFYRSDAGGNVLDTVQMPVVTIGPRQQLTYDNVLQSLFAQSIGVFGPIRLETTGDAARLVGREQRERLRQRLAFPASGCRESTRARP